MGANRSAQRTSPVRPAGGGTWTAILLVVVTLAAAAAPLHARRLQNQAAPTLEQLGDDVDSSDPKVRRKALEALAGLGAEGLDPLSRLVADPVRAIRRDAIAAVLAIYVQPPAGEQVKSAEDAFEWAPYRATPWAQPSDLVTNLVRALGDEWSLVRRDAVYALGVVSAPPVDKGLANELIFSLADPAAPVRLAAARVLGRLRVTQAGDPLIGHIGDQVLAVRLASMRALGEIQERRALVALRQQLDYFERGSAGRAALDGLARIAHPSSAALFAEERHSSNAVLRRHAYEGLARLGGIPAGEVAMVEAVMTEERNTEAGLAMAFALAAAGHPYVDRIVQALAVRGTAEQALEYVVELGRSQPDAIVPHLQHADAAVREHVAMAVGFVGGTNAEAALTQIANDSSPEVRHAAEVALMRMRVHQTPTERR
ncbi:MAG: HEAT repeat domain-containing protein [Acidobacteriota bacterium]|nr:HEAT repeat domain-containing protein [Acidobacteriota bacterium]